MPAFEGKARVLLVDLPGHGKSDRPAVDYTMDRFADAVDAVLRDAGVERALLVGHSMGTPVARQFFRKYPQKTLGIAAVDGALRSFFKDPSQADKFVAMVAGPDFDKTVIRFLEGTFVRVDAREREGRRARDGVARDAAGRRQRHEGTVRPRDLDGRPHRGPAPRPRREGPELDSPTTSRT